MFSFAIAINEKCDV